MVHGFGSSEGNYELAISGNTCPVPCAPVAIAATVTPATCPENSDGGINISISGHTGLATGLNIIGTVDGLLATIPAPFFGFVSDPFVFDITGALPPQDIIVTVAGLDATGAPCLTTATFTIGWDDAIPPMITCPADIMLDNDPEVCVVQL